MVRCASQVQTCHNDATLKNSSEWKINEILRKQNCINVLCLQLFIKGSKGPVIVPSCCTPESTVCVSWIWIFSLLHTWDSSFNQHKHFDWKTNDFLFFYSPPVLNIENAKGLSKEHILTLQKELNKMSVDLCGEVCFFFLRITLPEEVKENKRSCN